MDEMDEQLWTDVDRYIGEHVGVADPDLDAALAHSTEAGLPEIAVSPPQGKLLMLLAASIGARRILEIGTLGGYSTIWLARALPGDGELVTCEYSASTRSSRDATSTTQGSALGSTSRSVPRSTRCRPCPARST